LRAILSLAALLIVVFLVSKLAGTQLKAIAPAAPSGAASAATGTAAEQAAAQVVRAVEQGAAQRADDAASR
jgi:hypothetical protein